MKNIIIMTTFFSLLILQSYAQESDKTAFTLRMNDHITHYLSDDKNMAKAKELYGHTCDIHHAVTPEEIKARAAEAEKHTFIQANMDEYMRLYFPEQIQSSRNTNVTICDNGGFEQDFLHYTGHTSQFEFGSTTCNPTWLGVPSIFNQVPLPSPKEFEIVSSGPDPITGIQKVKFGSKSLKINDPFLHPLGGCGGNFGINRLKKEFLVTKENREFTVWYSIAIENPVNHKNQSPFLSIKCDLAPYTDLCFDSDILDCDSLYSQPGCGNNNLMDVLDWTCHSIKIPESQVGNIATLEITMSDCGQGAHNGYAYIDGICESGNCVGGPLGSAILSQQSPMVNGFGIDYLSCNGDIARVCGSYTDPTLCGTWQLDSIVVPGIPISNVSIDTINKKFCFDINKNTIGSSSKAEIFVAAYFKKNGGGYLPVSFSNSIYLYKNLFTQKHTVEFNITGCFDNKTSPNVSDDYYMVEVKVVPSGNENWNITRRLLNPYPGESGISQLDSGTGAANLILGPFLIQEGSWELIVTIGECTYKYIINPPPFCSGCTNLSGIKINNVTCIPGPPDQWTFNISIPNTASGTIGGTFKVEDINGMVVATGTYGGPSVTMPNLPLDQSCVKYRIRDVIDETCFVDITVCPPIPCSDLSCALDVKYIVKCLSDSPTSPYTVQLFINNGGSPTVCVASPNTFSGGGSSITNGGLAGTYAGDVTLVVYTCPGGGCSCTKPSCFKVIKIFKTDCGSGHFNLGIPAPPKALGAVSKDYGLVNIIPNPINNNELKIISQLEETNIKVYSSDGRLVHTTTFTNNIYMWDMAAQPAGAYILQYIDDSQKIQTTKFIKH